MRSSFRLLTAALLGVGTAVLVSCGNSGKGLIPLAYAGPLKNDFQAVLQAAQEGDGSCTMTEAAIRKTEHDLQALPFSVDDGLRGRLAEGVANLSVRARQLCAQPLAQTTTTSTTTTPTKTNPPATGTTKTQTTPTTSTPTPTTGTSTTGTSPAPPAGEEGGTQAPGVGGGEVQPGEVESGGGQASPGATEHASGSENGLGGATGGTGGSQ
jgi:hypothetical protein